MALHESNFSKSLKDGVFGRRIFRFLTATCIILVSLWFLAPFFHSPPPHHRPPFEFPDDVDDSHRPPPHPLPDRPGRPPHSPEESTATNSIWYDRKLEVRAAYVHAINGYNAYAFPSDELLPISGGNTSKFNGWAVTLLDSLDTMWLMGLHDDFSKAVQVVAGQRFHMRNSWESAPFFETVIRYLGGLLSAYALSREPILLSRADDLGRLLLPVFNTSSGLPLYGVNTDTGSASPGWVNLFAESASCQLEYKYLAKMTGKAEYYEKVENVMNVLYNANVTDGLFPEKWTYDGRPAVEHFGVGAGLDSGYEYFLKQWVLTGDERARNQYLVSIEGIIQNLLFLSPTRKLLYVTDIMYGAHTNNLEHLSCFLPGVIALGAQTISDLPPETKELHQWAAAGLAYTCWVTYADQQSGLGPDGMRFENGGKWVDHLKTWKDAGRIGGSPPGLGESPPEKEQTKRDYLNTSRVYLLRPETVESIYLMWKTTGEEKWRERGYEIFKSLEANTMVEYGYACVAAVDTPPFNKIDDMPSYFLAETLKYLYLLFDDSDPISLDKWVFNTEAHPLPVFEWSEWEKKAYNITSLSSESHEEDF